ncbi:MAG: glycoside hydrolase family 99-like domain-containing protein [Candidatus Acidiferrales bacterium]
MSQPGSDNGRNSSNGQSDQHVPASGVVRAIALYLPQFHPIPENDEWWGKGFTEWANVVNATPRFSGHYQPHLPADLGFYDLRVPETRAAQAELAVDHGIHGFCYYHYWFNGRRILERPMNDVWKSGEPDFPFCICWANENWTRRWDGLDAHLLLEQRYSASDDLAHIRSLIPVFSDRRYIRVDDRPLFLVYRASQLPEPQKTTEIWRREAERAGLKGLYLVRVESFPNERGDPHSMGFDCALEFQPRWSDLPYSRIARRKWWHRRKLRTAEPAFYDNCICEYEKVVTRALAEPVPPHPRIPSVCLGWDNSPRRKQGAHILVNSTPEIYERWLREVANRRLAAMRSQGQSPSSVESLLFVNAWNEWGEGTHLEPCQKWGRGYLEATRRALAVVASRSVEYAER